MAHKTNLNNKNQPDFFIQDTFDKTFSFSDGYEDFIFTPETDSLKNAAGYGDCNPGYILNSDTKACNGSVFEMNSRKALSYKWSPGKLFNDSTIQNPWLVVDSTRTYYLETTNYKINLVLNPDFEMGNTGFVTDYTYCNDNNCLWPLGDNGYSIGADAGYFLTTYFSGYDHTSGSGNFMIVNGGRPTLKVWRQSIAVKPNTEYTLGLWICRLSEYDTAKIRITVNDAQLGTTYTVPAFTNQWEQVQRTWNSGSYTIANLEIIDMRPVETGNDFGLDDLFFGELTSCTDNITITASENVNLGHDTIISPGQKLVIAPLNGPFEKYNWNTGETTKSILISKAGKYWLSVTDQDGCISTDTINVKNSEFFVVFPNAFTPNADRLNDVFRPKTSNVNTFHMSVFNRWGQLLFETNDSNSGWNGMIDGKYCEAGLYVYSASYELQNESVAKTVRGSFILVL